MRVASLEKGPLTCDNEDGPGSVGSAHRSLTAHLVLADKRPTVNATRICTVEGCENPTQARGLCNTHYSRWRKTGTTDAPKIRTLADRLWSRTTETPTGCWEFTGYRNVARGGYGRIHDDAAGRVIGAHVAAWIVTQGAIPAGMIVRHRCDNPPCCNPAHLELGSYADNTGDKIARGRQARGEGNGIAKLTEADVRNIRARTATTEVRRRIAEDYGVDPSLITQIAKRHIWKVVAP